eukprot:TRINITY_DN49819_c0_g1_i1.p1 TRINITY_DN49819_c0_g1~~TRINITY_DN49819_c0_g1_i1.p1  ORF type:complete len:379 (+),score=50.51 TRINITY_DN49819_c0_g1_i1:71-1207(+)
MVGLANYLRAPSGACIAASSSGSCGGDAAAAGAPSLALARALLLGGAGALVVVLASQRVVAVLDRGVGAALAALKRFILSTRPLQLAYTVLEQKRLRWQYGQSLQHFMDCRWTKLHTADLKGRQVECAFDRVNQYAGVALPELTASCPALRSTGAESPAAWATWVDEVLSAVLASGAVTRNGQPVKLEDCVIVDCLSAPGAYFPRAHTDVEWYEFPGADGFQCWYLAKRSGHPGGEGNMFICPSAGQSAEFTPSECIPRGAAEGTGEGREVPCAVRRCIPTLGAQLCPPACGNVGVRAQDLRYLDLDLGTCFVFGPHLWHFSDPRQPGTDRVAVNFRVVLREADGSIRHRGNGAYMRAFKHTLRDGRLYNVGRYDLMH